MPEFGLEMSQLQFMDEKVPLRIEGLSREDLLRRPEGRGNPVLWILGHMATSRAYLLEWIGAPGAEPVGDEEEAWFGIGCRLAEGDPFPPTDELLDLFARRGRSLVAGLQALTEEDAAKELEFELPFGKTVRAAVEFMLFHEAFHMGQLSYLCGWLGNPLGA